MEEKDNNSSGDQGSHDNAEVSDARLFTPPEGDPSEVKVSPDANDNSIVAWEASEYIHHQKNMGWYLALTGGTVLLGVILYLLLKDVFSLVVLAVMYAAIVVYARREPRTLRYSLSSNGLAIGEKHFNYDQFRSFSVTQESGMPSVDLVPTQRFMPHVSIYFAPLDADKIVGELSKFIPNEQRKPNPVDRAMLKLRF